ncbi:MAG TPA: amidohydrolase family protein [Streptosporangiaceae bacterium]|nr:amidohydrolase family protein [Streptosporangiaceae bacterium]
MIIDAHHHVWDPAARRHESLAGRLRLRRPYGLDEYATLAAAEKVGASVLVQVLASTPETEEFLATAAGTTGHAPEVAGVVGWVDLTADDVRSELDRLRAGPGGDLLVGVRHLVQDEPDPNWLGRPDVRRGLTAVGDAGLVYDLLVRPPQLPAALRVATQLDEVRFVLDHAGKPEISEARTEPWAGLITEMAALPNLTCKLSGLVTEAAPAWTRESFEPYVDRLLESFGPRRLMFGSDWPVCTIAASYAEVTALARELLAPGLSQDEQAAVFGATAVTTYRLKVLA